MTTAQAPQPRGAGRDTLLAAAAMFAWLAATAWARPLMLPDEGRYVGVAWEMLRSGDWLTPTLDGLPFFHKPPLFYWITAASLSMFGMNEWAARLAPLLGATLGVAALYGFTRRWVGRPAARSAALVLAAQPLFFVGGQFANLDMLVAGCVTATVLALAHAVLLMEAGLPHRKALLGAHALAGLGVLAKGLIGFVIPALVVGTWLLLRGRWRTVPRLLWPPALAVFALVAVPWFVAMQGRFDGFLHYFFVVQHLQRFAAGGFNNVQPFWFFAAVVLLLSLPWLPWLQALFVRGGLSAAHPRGPLRLLMGVAVLVVLVFFSLPQSKLVGYVLPAVPPLAWLIAEGRPGAGAARHLRRWWVATFCLTALAGLAAVVVLAAVDHRHSARDLGRVLRSHHAGHEPVVMLGGYVYDVPFYARLRDPVQVVADWGSPDVALRDNWRKEIADAGAFAPARAAALLVRPAEVTAVLCRTPVTWVITVGGDAGGVPAGYPFLAEAERVASLHGRTLWRVDSRVPALFNALDCPGTPNGGSADR
jgi:4-amino-4-deoxy-L-arabinose transferase-like glycosyltransferase